MDLFEEFCDGDIVRCQEFGDRNVILGLLEELSNADVVLGEELGDGDIISNLVKVVTDLVMEELSDSDVVGSGQSLGDVLHIGLQ